MKKNNLLMIFLIIISIVLILARINLILELPIFAYIDYISDDELMVHQAFDIKEGRWLGPYGYNTLLKSPVFPMFLALICVLKLPYIFSITMCYIVSCCLFVYSMKDVIKNKIVLFFMFAFMIFNPIMYSADFQRVYRNSLVPSLALLIISFLNMVLINRNSEKISFKYIIGIVSASIIFPFFYYIREDSIWLMPFMCFYGLIIFSSVIIGIIKRKKGKFIDLFKILSLFLPLVCFVIFNSIIGNINYKYYGEKIINMNDFTNLQEAINAINIVKNESNTEATNPREKMRRIYAISPTLNSMSETCERLQDNIAGKDKDVKDGMFLWVILETISQSGYGTLDEQNKVLKDIATEINTAIENGKLETQKLTPFFNDAAYYKFDIRKIGTKTLKAFKVINNYNMFGVMDTYGSLYESDQFETRIRYFLEVTNDKLLLNNEEKSWNKYGALIKDNQKEYLDRMQPKIDTLRDIRTIYNNVSNIINPIGYISYVILSGFLVLKLIKRKIDTTFDKWIITSGILGSVITLCIGIGYTTAVKVDVAIPFYLMSGYVLNSIFCLISIIFTVEVIVNFIKERKHKVSE